MIVMRFLMDKQSNKCLLYGTIKSSLNLFDVNIMLEISVYGSHFYRKIIRPIEIRNGDVSAQNVKRQQIRSSNFFFEILSVESCNGVAKWKMLMHSWAS